MSNRIETYDGAGNLVTVEDNRLLEDVKRAKWDEINEYREVILNRGIWFIGHHWDSSERARSNVTGALTGAMAGIPLPPDFTWRDNDNINVPFDVTMLTALGGYIMSFVNMVYAASWNMKTIIDGFATREEVDAFIVADQAWPDGNMDGTRPV